LFHLKRSKEFRLSWRQCVLILLYTLAMAVVLVVIHEAAHILTAITLGARLSEFKIGFLGINRYIK